MDAHTDLVDRYFAVWNEPDAERRRELIARTWAADARYSDPLLEGRGHDGIDAMVQGVQQQFAGHRFRQTSAVDAHHDCIRFSWALAPEDGPPLALGTDVAVVTDDGRLQTVIGFFDQTPGGA